VTAAKLAPGAVVGHLGYSPVNKAGDMMTGPLNINNQRLLHVYVNQGNDTNARYYYLGRMHNNNGILKINGILAGHSISQGRANIDLQLTFRDGFRADGFIMGTVDRADLLVKDGNDGWAYVYLVTYQWALVNLELSRVGDVEIHYDNTYSTTAPGGGTTYQLSSDFSYYTHPNSIKVHNGNLNIAGEYRGRYDHQNRFVMQKYVDNVTLIGFSSKVIATTTISIPSGKALYLRRVRWALDSSLLPRIYAGLNTWSGSTSSGDVAMDVFLSNSSPVYIGLQLVNSSSNNVSTSERGIWAEFEIR
jgi:hypothetical protein